MKYLDCIEMLNYALNVLKVDSRVQVPVSKMQEVLMILTRLSKRMENDASMQFATLLNDSINAIGVVQSMSSIKYLSDTMKQTLAEGLYSIKFEVATVAFNYYSTNDFEPTDTVIPLMRDVVKTVSLGGIQI